MQGNLVSDDLTPTSIRLSESQQRRMKQVCLDRNTTQTQIIFDALEAYLAALGVAPEPPPGKPPYSKAIRRLHELLDAVLNDGDKDQVSIVKGVIQWAYKTVQKEEQDEEERAS